jgi:hypothetical protein
VLYDDPSGVANRELASRPIIAKVVDLEVTPLPLHGELAEKLAGLPKDLAVTLLSLGVVGVMIPGPVPPGKSFILLGVVMLFPGVLANTGGCLARKFPRVFRMLISFTDHLSADLARRYPESVRA